MRIVVSSICCDEPRNDRRNGGRRSRKLPPGNSGFSRKSGAVTSSDRAATIEPRFAKTDSPDRLAPAHTLAQRVFEDLAARITRQEVGLQDHVLRNLEPRQPRLYGLENFSGRGLM